MLSGQQNRTYVAGADTLIGAAIVRRLRSGSGAGADEVVGVDGDGPDYTNASDVEAFFGAQRPTRVFVAAGESGGILANQRYPARLMHDNLLAATNLIDAAHRHGVAKLLYLASSCCYPRLCPQPMQVGSLLTGPLEPTNEPYALAKLAGVRLCQSYRRQYGSPFIVGIPANAFGPGDHFDAADGHVVPSLMVRFHEAIGSNAPEVVVWGTGQARREFIFGDDLADACLTVMEKYDGSEPINLGSGAGVTIRELVEVIVAVSGYRGRIRFDTTKPDGMPAKALDGSALAALGWRPANSLESAIRATWQWYLDHQPLAKETGATGSLLPVPSATVPPGPVGGPLAQGTGSKLPVAPAAAPRGPVGAPLAQGTGSKLPVAPATAPFEPQELSPA